MRARTKVFRDNIGNGGCAFANPTFFFSTRQQISDPNVTQIYVKILNFNTKIISKTPFITHKTVGNKMHEQCESHPYIFVCVVEMEGKKVL